MEKFKHKSLRRAPMAGQLCALVALDPMKFAAQRWIAFTSDTAESRAALVQARKLAGLKNAMLVIKHGPNLIIQQHEDGLLTRGHTTGAPFIACDVHKHVAISEPPSLEPMIVDDKGFTSADEIVCRKCARETREAHMLCHASGGPHAVIDLAMQNPWIAGMCGVIEISNAQSHNTALIAERLRNDLRGSAASHQLHVLEESEPWEYAEDKWLTPANLQQAGFWTTETAMIFRNDYGLDGVMVDKDFVSEGLKLNLEDKQSDFAIRELITKHAVKQHHVTRLMPKTKKEGGNDHLVVYDEDLIFDSEHVRKSFLLRRTHALMNDNGATVRRMRHEHCKPCVYGCRYPGQCTLRESDIIAQWPKSAEEQRLAKQWVAMFAFSGAKIDEGKRTPSMIWGPEYGSHLAESRRFIVRKLRPPYASEVAAATDVVGVDFDIKLEEAIADLEKTMERYQNHRTEFWPMLFFALRGLWSYCHWRRRPEFSREHIGQKESHPSDNDALGIYLDTVTGVIYAYTDTKASSHGGRANPEHGAPLRKMLRGKNAGKMKRAWPPIKPEERPRFTTKYQYPYFNDLMLWTGVPLGSKRDRSRSRLEEEEQRLVQIRRPAQDQNRERKERTDAAGGASEACQSKAAGSETFQDQGVSDPG